MSVSQKLFGLRFKLACAIVLLALAPLAFAAISTYGTAADALEKQATSQLAALRDVKRRQVEDQFVADRNVVAAVAQDSSAPTALRAFEDGFRAYEGQLSSSPEVADQARAVLSGYYADVFLPQLPADMVGSLTAQGLLPATDSALAAQYHYLAGGALAFGDQASIDQAYDSSAYGRAHAKYDRAFRQVAKRFGFGDLYFVTNSGDVVYSVEKNVDFGTNLVSGPFKDTNLSAAFRASKSVTTTVVVVDYARYAPALGAASAFLASPVYAGIERVGVAVCQVRLAHINHLVTNDGDWASMGLGDTGQIYLVGPDSVMRTDVRSLARETDPLVQRAGTTALVKSVDNEAVVDALSGKSATRTTTDARGDVVISAYGPLDAGGLMWSIVVEKSRAEAIAPAQGLRNEMILRFLVTALLVVGFGVYVAHSITSPILRLAEAASEAAAGNLAVQLPKVKSRDEIGTLTSAFTNMLHNLRVQASELQQGVNVLASSASEISSSVAQLASSAAETATAISQTTTTVEQVEQTAQLSNEKARAVAERARGAASVAEQGLAANGDVTAGMGRIRSQMETIADSVAQLSQQSQAIGGIISSVNDLADQSNLLAVNAAIEAAKAGDQGRGFAVVAQEIRNLAEQSKQATAKVREILGDIQKAMSNAVMATEQGSKVVEAGEKQVADAGRALQALTTSVNESVQSANQIAASSQQQMVGMKQIATAMESIRQAGTQNADSAVQLQEAAHGLSVLGDRLKALTDTIQV